MKRVVFQTMLFTAYPVISLYSANLHQTLLSDIFLPLSVILPVSLLLLFLLNRFLKNLNLSGLIVSTSFLLVFLYGPLRKISKGIPIIKDYLTGGFLSILISTVLLILIICYLKNRKKLGFIYRFFKILALILIIMPLFPILTYYFNNLSLRVSNGKNNALKIPAGAKNNNPPDIYYFILDRYAGASTLSDYFQFDNTPFLSSLESKGFYVNNDSWANYHSSAHSISSSLNMKYLDFDKVSGDFNQKDWNPVYKLIQNHLVGRNLHKLKFQYIHFGSWWWPTSKNNLADRNVKLGLLSEFSSVLISNTVINPLADSFNLPLIDSRYNQWRRINYQFNELKKIPFIKSPTFVFAHLIIPHEPFVFNADGSFLKSDDEVKLDLKTKYVNQVLFVNGKLTDFINRVFATEKNSIIIFQADEGPYPDSYEKNKNTYNWKDVNPADIKTKMSILNVVYLPDGNYSNFKKTNSPVNTFRIIFNQYFGFDYPLLSDRYFMGNMQNPYDLMEIKK